MIPNFVAGGNRCRRLSLGLPWKADRSMSIVTSTNTDGSHIGLRRVEN
jgi:hypothetical protein